MAENNPVSGKDLYKDDGTLDKLEKDLTDVEKKIKSVEESVVKLKKSTENLNSTNKKQRDSIQDNAVKTDKLANEHKKLKESYSNTAVEIKKVQNISKKQNQIQKLEIQLAKSAKGSYNQLSAQYSLNKIKLNAMSKATRENTVAGRALEQQSKVLYTRMSQLQKQTGKNQLDVGKYGTGLKQTAGSMLGFVGVAGAAVLILNKIKQAVRSAINIFVDYDKIMFKVEAISGATSEQVKKFRSQAESLGESTEKTAKQVGQLQLELAKLGFSPEQIIEATGAILDLSTAIDSDLAQSAKVVGQVLRAFDLEAEETQRVTDLMSEAFSNSSLDISKFESAMSTVAPVAKAFGFSVEEATALLAQLTDAGFDASSAGTATRNILLNLADSNGDLAKALGGSVTNMDELLDGLDTLNEQGIDLNKTLQLTDKRSVAAFNRFINATDQTRKLTKQLNNAEGASARMAKIMRDNLAGDTDKARSAMEGLSINVVKKLNPGLRKSTQAITKFVEKLSSIIKIDASEVLKNEREEVIALTSKLKDANTTYDDRLTIITKLKDIAPDIVKGINAEEIAYDDLNKQLDLYLAKMIEKIALAKLESERESDLADIADLRIRQSGNMVNAAKLLFSVEKKYKDESLATQDQLKDTIKTLQAVVDEQERLGETGKKITSRTGNVIDLRTKEQKQLLDLINTMSYYNRKSQEIKKIEDGTLSTLNEKIIALREVLGISADENVVDGKKKNIKTEVDKVVKDYSSTLKELREELSKLKEEESEISLSDEKKLISKQIEIDKLEELIKKYEQLGASIKIKAPKFEDIDINETIDIDFDSAKIFADLEKSKTDELKRNLEARKRLEEQQANSLIGLLINSSAKKRAITENMNADEIDKMLENNSKIEESLTTSTEFAIDQLNQLYEAKIERAEEDLRLAERGVDMARVGLDAEIRARELGLANSVMTAQKEFAEAKKQQEKANKEKAKAVKQQQTLDSITQASSLITASANIWSSMSSIPVIGSVLALAAIALMWGSFAYSKVKANQATSYGEGGSFDAVGGTHSSGNDISLGVHGGKERRVEGGEKVGIFNKKAVKKYGNINEIINSINNRDFELNFGNTLISPDEMPSNMLINAGVDSPELLNIKKDVKKIRKQGDRKTFTDASGRTVVTYKNLKTRYV